MGIAKQDRTTTFLFFLLLLLPEIGTMGITRWWEQLVGGLKRLGLLGGRAVRTLFLYKYTLYTTL